MGWTAADRTRKRAQQAAVRAGTWVPLHPVGPVADHVETLLGYGVMVREIAALAGVHPNTVSNVRTRRFARMHGPNAAAILAVHVADSDAARRYVGTLRRVRALAARGWPIAWQERQAIIGRGALRHLANGTTRHVTPPVAQAIRSLYARYADREARDSQQSRQVREYAADRGWVGPGAWTTATIDNPVAVPHGHLRRVA